jgi:hypothetical protein
VGGERRGILILRPRIVQLREEVGQQPASDVLSVAQDYQGVC